MKPKSAKLLVMDHQQSKLVSKASDILPSSNHEHPGSDGQENVPGQNAEPQKEPPQQTPLDIIDELQNNNPLPLLAVLDQVDIYTKTKEGVPLFNLLMNKFLPLSDLLENGSIKFLPDADGRTPLHYAVEVDDAKAVQWLLSKGARNDPDNFGNTPAMDAVRLGHRRSFLLCLHYQHVGQQLPHVGAKYNRVWELRCMLALGLSLEAKDKSERTPLQIAVQNYSYQAVEYLASVASYVDVTKLNSKTDSVSIQNRIQKGVRKSSTIHRTLIPLLQKVVQLIMIMVVINYSDFLVSPNRPATASTIGTLVLCYAGIQVLMVGLSKWMKPEPKSAESIPRLLHEPYFPNSLDHICPSCFNRYHPERQDHCDICHVCVPKFHQHSFTCINKSNQLIWFTGEFLYAYIVCTILQQAAHRYNENYQPAPVNASEAPPTPSTIYSLVMYAYYYGFVQKDTALVSMAVFLLALMLLAARQLLMCCQLIGMAFMNRTYQQVTRSQDYPHLFTVFKDRAGKLKTREFRIFFKYKVCGGLCMGLRNLLLYFC